MGRPAKTLSKSASIPAKLTAKQLIEQHRHKQSSWLPSEEALAELEELMKANDAETNRYNRVPMRAAMELLHSYGWPCGAQKFSKMLREQYGRSWERPSRG